MGLKLKATVFERKLKLVFNKVNTITFSLIGFI